MKKSVQIEVNVSLYTSATSLRGTVKSPKTKDSKVSVPSLVKP